MRAIGKCALLWLLLTYSWAANAADWGLSEIGYSNGPIPELTLYSARPVSTFGDVQLKGIFSSEPPLPWECLILNEHELRCSVDYEVQRKGIALASRLNLALAEDRLIDQQGEPLAGHQLVLPTPLPALRVKPDWEEPDPHLLRVLAPMALSEESIHKALRVTIDSEPVNYTLRSTGPIKRLDFNSHNWPAMPLYLPEGARNVWWSARVTHAWQLRLERLPQPGQTLDMRLFGGLASSEGKLTNQPVDRENGDLILTFTAPTAVEVQAGCFDVSTNQYSELTEQCPPEHPLSLQFSGPISPAALEAISNALPQPLTVETPVAPVPVFARTFQYQFPERLELQKLILKLRGAGPVSSYRLPLGEAPVGVFGESASSREVTWKTVAWKPMVAMAPKYTALRRGDPQRTRMFLRGQDQIGADMTWTLADGAVQRERVVLATDPLLGEAANVTLPFPNDVALIGRATSDLPESAESTILSAGFSDEQADAYRQSLRAGASVAVTDFGLHTLVVGQQLIVVVSNLDDGGPAAGVELRLLAGQKRLARGRSDARGLSVLRYQTRSATSIYCWWRSAMPRRRCWIYPVITAWVTRFTATSATPAGK